MNKQTAEIIWETKDMSYIRKKIEEEDTNDAKYQKDRNDFHYAGDQRGAEHSICNWNFIISKETVVISHINSLYDYHFIINKLAEKFERKLTD